MAHLSRSLRLRPHSRSTPEKYENQPLCVRLGLPSTLIRHKNGAFRKRSSNRGNLKTPALRFSVDAKTFENGSIALIAWFPCPSVPQTQIQTGRWLLYFKFLWRSVDKNHWIQFQINAVFKFLRRIVDWALDVCVGPGPIQPSLSRISVAWMFLSFFKRYFELFWRCTELPSNWRNPENV